MTTALTSPGAALTARHELELALTQAMDGALGDYAQVIKALAADPTGTLTLGAVLGPWKTVVETVMTVLAPYRLDQEYLVSLNARLMVSDLPGRMHDSARVVLQQSADQRWSRRRLLSELSKALDPTTPFVQMVVTAALEPADAPGQSAKTIAAMVARTEATAAHGHAVLTEMASLGHPTKKWVAHHDKITRPTHANVDGAEVGVSEPFIVGGFSMMYPGDPSAPLDETANCRCVLVATGEATAVATLRDESEFGLEKGVVSVNGVEALTSNATLNSFFMAEYSPEEKLAQSMYASSTHFFAIRNAFLRGDTYLDKNGTNIFDTLQTALAKTTLVHDVKLYRALRLSKVAAKALTEPGTVIEHPFFASTAVYAHQAQSYGAGESKLKRTEKEVIMQILTPKGTHVLPGMKDEFVLGPGSKMKVRRSYEFGNKTYLVVDLL